MKNRKITHRILSILLTFAIVASLCSCAKVDSDFNDLNGSITGNTYECQFYSNDGQKFMTVSGSKIDMNSNIIRERTFNGDSWEIPFARTVVKMYIGRFAKTFPKPPN